MVIVINVVENMILLFVYNVIIDCVIRVIHKNVRIFLMAINKNGFVDFLYNVIIDIK
jgi:hypothetical protein